MLVLLFNYTEISKCEHCFQKKLCDVLDTGEELIYICQECNESLERDAQAEQDKMEYECKP